MEPLKVDIWSDIACPFCYMGKRKFETAVAQSGVDVVVEYHSFELSPDTPQEYEGSHAEKLAVKMQVDVEQARTMEAQLSAKAREVDLELDYDRLRPTRTLLAHELLHYAKAHGVQGRMKERLMAAYFTEGRHVGRIADLAELAAEIGLDPGDVVRSLETGEHREAVAADITAAGELGIRGVPFFVVDQRYAVSGAQDPSVFAEVLTQARDEKESAA